MANILMSFSTTSINQIPGWESSLSRSGHGLMWRTNLTHSGVWQWTKGLPPLAMSKPSHLSCLSDMSLSVSLVLNLHPSHLHLSPPVQPSVTTSVSLTLRCEPPSLLSPRSRTSLSSFVLHFWLLLDHSWYQILFQLKTIQCVSSALHFKLLISAS